MRTPLSQDESIESALLYSAYRKNVLDAAMTVAATAVGGVLMWPYFEQEPKVIWATVMVLMSAIAFLNCWAFFKAAPQGQAIVFWRRVLMVQITFSGLCWSVGPVLMMWPIAGPHAVLFVGILFCVSAVVVASLSEQRGAMQGFLIAAMLPTAMVALASGGALDRVVALVLLGGMVALIVVGRATHQTARGLLESQLYLNAVLANVPDAVLAMDGQGRITDWNQRAQEIFGWSRSEALGSIAAQKLAPPRAPGMDHPPGGLHQLLSATQADHSAAPGTPTPARTEATARRKGGEEFPVEVVVTPLHIGGEVSYTAFVSDIAERKKSQERLNLFRRLFDESTQCVGITNPSGELLYQNRAQATELGYSHAELIGQSYLVVVPQDRRDAFASTVQAAARADEGWSGTLVLQRKDGSVFTSMSNIGFIKDAAGLVQYAFNIYTDITDEMARSAELAAAKDEAERANLAKSDFLSSMSHELRTPMNAILGFAQILQYDRALTADQKDSVQEIFKAGRHLLALINEVLDLAKIEAGKVAISLENVNLSDLLQECQDLIQPLANDRQVHITVRIPAQCTVLADRTKLKQALINILSNAVKYNRDGGKVMVSVESERGAVRVSIEDTGVGIAEQRMGELFQPFSRLEAEGGNIEGTGIGLTITRRLVELMGGSMGVRSTAGVGTTFWVLLPLGDGDNKDYSATDFGPSTVPAHLAQRASGAVVWDVLSVDDNPVNLRLMEALLARRSDLRVRSAKTPEMGIELALGQTPAVVLLDIDMPRLDGYQVLAILKANPRLAKVPVIAVTANAMPRDMERGLAAGFSHYLTKPLNTRLLLKAIDEALQTHKMAPT